MTFFSILTAFLQAATAYFSLKSKTAYFDLLETFDKRLDKLDIKRQSLRRKLDSQSQDEADEISLEIEEEQKKKREIINHFKK